MRKIKFKIVFILMLIFSFFSLSQNSEAAMQRLKVSDNGRFLVKEDGTPFFWMGDTAWSIATINSAEVSYYMHNRAQKQFNIIHVDADSYGEVNTAGERPFVNENPDNRNEKWWQYIDYIIDEAAKEGIYVCLFPMWGAILEPVDGGTSYFWGGYLDRFSHEVSTAKAYDFGQWIGNRYKDKTNVVWGIAGEYESINGYRPPTPNQKTFFNAVAQGIKNAYGGTQVIMTIHSGTEFNSESWHDFTMLQTGHRVNSQPETYEVIKSAYDVISPKKPVLDGELAYEYEEASFSIFETISPAVVRRKTYWSVFAGGFGVTYGHRAVETMNNPRYRGVPSSWQEKLDALGAQQMKHLRSLMESLPDYLNRIPDQSVVVSGIGSGITHVQATRDAGGKYALVYIPDGHNVTVNMAKISGTSADASWYNPQTGEYAVIGNFPNTGIKVFDAPGAVAEGNDWVLVLKKQGNSEKIIRLGDTWQYKEGTSTPDASWKGLSFTGSWPEGPTMIGRGTEAYATTISNTSLATLYARKSFALPDTSNITGMKLYVGYDDGFVAYINGQEIVRSANMPAGAPNHTTVTGTSHEVNTVEIYDLSSNIGILENGNNVLAIEIHNKSLGTGDIGIRPELEIASQVPEFAPADLNIDTFVNIQDVQLCINVILETETDPAIIARAKAVAVPLDICDVLDLQAIVNEILR